VHPYDEDEEKDDQFFYFPSNGAPAEWNWQVKTEILGEKPVPVPLCPPQIPHGSTWDRTRAVITRMKFHPNISKLLESTCESCHRPLTKMTMNEKYRTLNHNTHVLMISCIEDIHICQNSLMNYVYIQTFAFLK
jgi:hypothetical protein